MSRASSKDDDMRSVTSFYAKSVAPELENEGTVVRVYEICTNSVVENFLEFGASTILIRSSLSGSPGPIVGSVVANDDIDQFQLFFYADFDFFHLFDKGTSVTLCTPFEGGRRFVDTLRDLFLTVVKLPVVNFPSLFSCVPCSLKCVTAVKQAVSAKQRTSSLSQPSRVLSQPKTGPVSSNLSTLVHQVSLLIEQQQPFDRIADLFTVLKFQILSQEVPRQAGSMFDDYASVILTLLDATWNCSYDLSLRELVSDCLLRILSRLHESNLGFLLTSKFFFQLQQAQFAILDNLVFSADSSSRTFEVALIALFGFLKTSEIVKHIQSELSKQGSGTLLKRASTCCKLLLRSLHKASQTPSGDFEVSIDYLGKLLDPSVTIAATNSLPEQQPSVQVASNSMFPSFSTLIWPGVSSCAAVVCALLDEVIAVHFTTDISAISALFHQCVKLLTKSVGILIDSVLVDPVPNSKPFLHTLAPSLATYFRRIPLWTEYGALASVEPHVFFHAVGFLVILFVARYADPGAYAFCQCEWLSKLSISCSHSAIDGYYAQMHNVFVKFTSHSSSWSEPRSVSNLLFRSVLEQLKDIQQRVVQSAPSPSLLLSIWSECLDHTETYAELIRNPLAFDSCLAVTMAVFPRSYFISRIIAAGVSDAESDGKHDHTFAESLIPFISSDNNALLEWDDLKTYSNQQRLRSSSQQEFSKTSSATLQSLSVGLSYIVPWIQREKLAGRLNTIAKFLFVFAEVLMSFPRTNDVIRVVLTNALRLAVSAGSLDGESCVLLAQFSHQNFLFLPLWTSLTPREEVTSQRSERPIPSFVSEVPPPPVKTDIVVSSSKRYARNLLDKFV